MVLNYRAHLLASTLFVAAGGFTTPALGQSTPAAPSASSGIPVAVDRTTLSQGGDAALADEKDIVVTGSRIAGITNLNNPSPVSVSTAAEIQLTKASSVEDILQRMVGPDANGIAASSNNGGDGNSTVSLRSLGPARTLVLMDSTRLIPNGGSVDLSIVPVNMIERVEVLRDGASSIYGADAIGGVVNLIMKHDVQGLTVDASGGGSKDGGGGTYHAGLLLGTNIADDRGNVTIAVNWDHRAILAGADRDWANNPYIGTSAEGGSAYRTQLDVLQSEAPVTLQNATVVNGVLQPAGSTISGLVAINGQFYTRTNPAIASLAPSLLYLPNLGVVKLNANGNPITQYNSLAGELDRKQFGLSGHYDLTDHITFFADGFYTKRTSEQLLRPEPLLGDTIATFNADGSTLYPGLIIAGNAPGNTTGTTYAAYLTPTQFGPRTYIQDSQTFRARVGFRGTFGNSFKWELAGVEQQNTEDLAIANSGNWLHLGELEGVIPCIDAPGGCTNGQPNVQPNWFAGPNNIFTPEQLAYVKYTRHDQQTAYERYVYANLTGSLFNLPYGAVKASIGGEYRGEHLEYTPDQLTVEGFTANASQPTTGGYSVGSVYGELFVPLLQDVPFFKALDLSPSVRYDNYNTFGGATTYKIGANWSINSLIRLRGSYSTAFRAPQVSELFGGQAISDIGASGDPCETNQALAAGGNGNVGKGILTAGSACSRAVANGAAVTNFSDPLDLIGGSQIQTLIGGSPTLQPEKARAYTAGIVLTPAFIPGLTLGGDYYRTSIKNTVLTGGIAQNFGLDYILLHCYGAQQDAVSCAKVHRNSVGVITQVDSLNDNGGSQTVRGFDIELGYDSRNHITLPMDSSVHFNVQASHLIQNDVVDLVGDVTHYAGFFSTDAETIFPKWKVFANVDLTSGPVTLHYDMNYATPMNNYNGTDSAFGNHIPSMTYHAISVAYDIGGAGALRHARIILGVDNLLDKDPPFISSDSTSKANTIAGPYDVEGRFFYSRVSFSF